MKLPNQKLIIEQVDKKLLSFKQIDRIAIPPNGWINAIRSAMKMSLRQLGNRLDISPQSVREIENRESSGSITIKSLREVGNALNMKLVYGFIPQNKSIKHMIEQRAIEIATEIVNRTSHTMKLEDQENSRQRLEKAIKTRAEEIQNKMPRFLWD